MTWHVSRSVRIQLERQKFITEKLIDRRTDDLEGIDDDDDLAEVLPSEADFLILDKEL